MGGLLLLLPLRPLLILRSHLGSNLIAAESLAERRVRARAVMASSADDAADRLVSVLKQRAKFLEAQVNAGIDKDAVMARQVQSIRTAISTTKGLTLDNACKVTDEITSGPWNPDQKAALAAAVDDAINIEPVSLCTSRPQQHLDHVENFLTAKDWATVLNTDLSVDPKLLTVATRRDLPPKHLPSRPCSIRMQLVTTSRGTAVRQLQGCLAGSTSMSGEGWPSWAFSAPLSPLRSRQSPSSPSRACPPCLL